MASKRTKHRAYWAAVKAYASNDHQNITMANEVLKIVATNSPDRIVIPYIESLEETYGTASLKDVSNSTLWESRRAVEAFRQNIKKSNGR